MDTPQSSIVEGEVTTKMSRAAHNTNKRLARHFGTTQGKIMDAAHTLFIDHVEGVDAIQIPELMSSVADLEETVGRYIAQIEHLERLSYELAGFEADRVQAS